MGYGCRLRCIPILARRNCESSGDTKYTNQPEQSGTSHSLQVASILSGGTTMTLGVRYIFGG